jgi:protein NirF
VAGLYGSDGMGLLDLWHPEAGVRRILADYAPAQDKRPVYKMPHLEGWALAGRHAYLPAVGRDALLIYDRRSWEQVAHIGVAGQPVFAMAQPDRRRVWVNFAYPKNDRLQLIDTESRQVEATLKPGKGVLHMAFTGRGEEAWVSVRDAGKVVVYDTHSLEKRAEIPAQDPSGIFFTHRADDIGL